MTRPSRSYPKVSRDGLDRDVNGVSVVVASYREPDVTLRCLRSLAAQTLDAARYEIILVVNGTQAEDITAYSAFSAQNPEVRLRIIRSPLSGPSHPLNLGVAAARMTWITVVDDDDAVTPRYLEGLLTVAGPKIIPLTRIDDVSPDGAVNTDNRINDQISPLAGLMVPPEACMRALTFNTSKLVPTDWARHVMYDLTLASGQDVAFFGGLYSRYDFSFAVVPESLESAYLRSISNTSLTRRSLDFAFAVEERLDVIETLLDYQEHAPVPKRPLLETLKKSQAAFVQRYLGLYPERRSEVIETIRSRPHVSFPWDVITRNAADTLVVSVCFPPYSDPSAVTVAKRIAQEGDVADVLCCDMSAIRPVDPSLEVLAAGLVDTVTEVSPNMSFSNWSGYRDFILAGWRQLEGRSDWPYDRLYSRAMWPASHVLAGYIKIQRPSIRWVAEFSDPLSRDVHGRPRQGSLTADDLVDELMMAASRAVGIDIPDPISVFELAELLPYALADQVVFTNESQMRYMLSYCSSPQLARQVKSKAVLSPHPIPAAEFYRMTELDDPTRPGRASLAYFGSFYENRSLVDLIEALAVAPPSVQRLIDVDVYTDHQENIGRVVEDRDLHDVVTIRDTVGYLEFLNLTTKYDCLIVEDARTEGTHAINPYLPSKWSDYRGSGTAIWAFTEAGSTLSKMKSEYVSQIGHVDEASAVLADLAHRFGSAARDGLEASAGTRSRVDNGNR